MPQGRAPTLSISPHQLARDDVDDRHRFVAAVGDVEPLAVRARGRCPWGAGAGAFSARDSMLHLARGLARGDVDDAHRGRVLRGDEGQRPIAAEGDRARAGPGVDARQHLEGRGVDGDDLVVLLAGDVDHLAVGAQGHPLRLHTHLHPGRDLALRARPPPTSRRSPRWRRRAACRRRRCRRTRGPVRSARCGAAWREARSMTPMPSALRSAGGSFDSSTPGPAARRARQGDVEQLAVRAQLDPPRTLADGDAGHAPAGWRVSSTATSPLSSLLT